MTVIAWDGRSIAADKRAISSGMAFTTTKLRRIKRKGHLHEVLAWTGDQGLGEIMAKWYADGADPAAFPACQNNGEQWARLIIADHLGVKFFERGPVAVWVEDRFAAWGSGRDFAIAAMHLGKSAREAVEVACLFEIGCGNGITAVELS